MTITFVMGCHSWIHNARYAISNHYMEEENFRGMLTQVCLNLMKW